MTKVSERKMEEIRALADASYEALVVTAKASNERAAKRLEAKAAASK